MKFLVEERYPTDSPGCETKSQEFTSILAARSFIDELKVEFPHDLYWRLKEVSLIDAGWPGE